MQLHLFQFCEPGILAQWMLGAYREGGRSALCTVIEMAVEAFGHETTKRALLLVIQNDEFLVRMPGAR
jgi:hypothetical protein